MKPTNEFLQRNRRQGPTLWPTTRPFPLIDHCYQSQPVEGAGNFKDDTTTKRSFREISCRYLKGEAVATFVTEAALFSVITIIAAFGLILCANALVHLVQSVSVA